LQAEKAAILSDLAETKSAMVEVPESQDALVAAIAAQKVVNSWCMMLYDCYV